MEGEFLCDNASLEIRKAAYGHVLTSLANVCVEDGGDGEVLEEKAPRLVSVVRER